MSDHAWTQESLDAYLAGGLSASEREDVERHCAECAECTGLLQEAKQVDDLMNDLFADARPDAGLEARVIQKLRRAPKSRAGVFRFVGAAAAVLVLGLLGAVLQALVADSPKGNRGPVAQNNMREIAAGDRVLKGQIEEETTKKTFEKDDNSDSIDLIDIQAKYKLDITTADTTSYKETRESGGRIRASINKNYGYSGEGKNEPIVKLQTEVNKQSARTQEYFQREQRDLVEKAMKDIYKSLDNDIGKFKETEKGAGDTKDNSKGNDPGSSKGSPKDGYYQSADQGGSKEGGQGQVQGKSTYFNKQEPKADTPAANDKPGEKKPGKDNEPTKEEGDKDKKDEKGEKEKQPPPEQQPARKIIRTGDMEFEIDSFYGALDTITGLLRKTKGGFIATINSDKLPNGKMRGAIVVRMPPEFLDDFIKDLRGELAKVGELKGQRVGSSDVTKVYTDLESELRASRAVEERFLQIIKSGKGEIKDLIAAERELGIWRTKIEKLEGEIRYYNNLIALSTLTINLSEKSIQSPTALVVRENVTMNIEVDEVEKAQQAIIAGANLASGRITKADLKLFEAGQVRAVVHAEIPAKSADTFRDLLKKLGHVTHHEAQRTQVAEGGSGKPVDLKPKLGDVLFKVDLYNTANIKPKETYTIKIASPDVAAAFRRLKDAVQLAKGRVRHSHLDEQDKVNACADFHFDVSAENRPLIDKLLAEAGAVLNRNTLLAGVNEMSTDRKVGYQVHLRDLDSVKPKEIFHFQVTSLDVPAVYLRLTNEVLKLKGRVHKRQINEMDKYNIVAEFDFDLPTANKAEIDKALAAAGVVALRTSEQARPNEESTPLKVGYRLVVRSVTSVRPRDFFTVQLASENVAASHRKVYDEVLRLKGRIHKTELEEQDRINVTAQLIFDVAAQDKPAIDKLLGEVGALVARTNVQAGPKEDATDQIVGYSVSFKAAAATAPREKTDIKIQVSDVDQKAAEIREIMISNQGRVVDSQMDRQESGHVSALLVFEVPLSKQDLLVRQIKEKGTVVRHQTTRNQQVPDNELATAQIIVRLTTSGPIVPTDEGVMAQLRTGLYWAFRVLSMVMIAILTGLAFIIPVAIVLWVAYKVVAWAWPTPATGVRAPVVALTPEKPATGEETTKA